MIDSTFLQAALNYAEMGYPVFPCTPGGKEPACEHGCSDATTDAEQIERWWTARPNCNVAVATGGLCVLDIDPAGKTWLATVDAGQLMQGAVTATPRGGVHYWFRQDNGDELRNTAGTIAAGVDTRANGGYVLVPPSIVGDRPYHWVSELDTRLPPVPRWLVEMLGVRVPIRESVGERIESGKRNTALFRFAGYFRRAGMSAAEIAQAIAVVNRSRCDDPLDEAELTRIAQSAARFEPDFVEESLLLSHFGSDSDDDDGPAVKQIDARFPTECLETMPGVMREAFDHVIASAIKPQPELTLGALIAFFGAIFGRKVKDDYDTRTNVMVLALAPSGAGKEWPRQCNKRFLRLGGFEEVIGPERIGSHAGIVTAVHHHPVRLFQLDEIGRLLATMRDPKVSHLYNVGTVLMALYSSSNTTWIGDAYADLAKVKTIDQPHVCVYGTSVPESLYGGLTPENLTDGLVGRLLIFHSSEIPERRKPDRSLGDLPWNLGGLMQRWREFTPGGNLKCEPVEATKTREANERHESYCDEVNRRHRSEDNVTASVWARAPEKAAKLALIYACCEASDNKGEPVVTINLQAVNWGISLANYSTRLVLLAARNAIAGSRYEADLKFVFNAITGEITQRELTRKTQKLKQKQRVEILADLQASGAIEMSITETGKRPKITYRRRRDSL